MTAFLKAMKAVHWAQIGSALACALFVKLSMDPALASMAPVFKLIATAFGGTSLATGLGSDGIRVPDPGRGDLRGIVQFDAIATLSVLVFLVGSIATVTLPGCAWFKANEQTIKNDVATVLTDEEKACVFAEAATVATPVAADVVTACKLADATLTEVQSLLNKFGAARQFAAAHPLVHTFDGGAQ